MYGYKKTIAGKSEVGQRFDGEIGFWSPALFLFGTIFFLPFFAWDGFTSDFPSNTAYILLAATAIAFISITVLGLVNRSFRSCIINKKTKHSLHTGILWSNRILVVSVPMIIAALLYAYSDLIQTYSGDMNAFLVPAMILLLAVSVILAPRQLRHDKKLLKLIDEMYGDTQVGTDSDNSIAAE